MSRFSDILKGAELNEDLQKYILYLQKTKAEKSTAYQTATTGDTRLNVPRTNGFIVPFKADALKAALKVRTINASGSPPAPADTLANDVANYLKTAAQIDTADAVPITGKFRREPATLIYKLLKGTKNGVSRFTGRPYTARHSDSASSPFGKNTATDTEADVAAALRTKGDNFVNTGNGNHVYYIRPEGNVGVG